MDRHHEAGIKAFPAKTEGKGNQLLQPRMENGVKVYELTAEKIQWETEPGKRVEAFAYNQQVPGPQIRVTRGRPRARDRSTTGWSSPPPSTFTAWSCPTTRTACPSSPSRRSSRARATRTSSRCPNSGSHMYHSHHNAAEQVGKGLLGAFVVEPRQPARHREGGRGLRDDPQRRHATATRINGKGFPATEPIVAKMGQKVRVRFMNEGMMIHPMHLHGMHMTVIDKDGWPQPAPWKCDTLNVAPGERWDVIVNCNNPGVWAFHCHILPHAETPNGMFGMVTALIVEK